MWDTLYLESSFEIVTIWCGTPCKSDFTVWFDCKKLNKLDFKNLFQIIYVNFALSKWYWGGGKKGVIIKSSIQNYFKNSKSSFCNVYLRVVRVEQKWFAWNTFFYMQNIFCNCVIYGKSRGGGLMRSEWIEGITSPV